jgi:hypothetical protein
MTAGALAEVAGHGLHLALFGAGLVTVAALLWTTWGSRGGRNARRQRARVRALRAAARAGTLGAPGADPLRRDG